MVDLRTGASKLSILFYHLTNSHTMRELPNYQISDSQSEDYTLRVITKKWSLPISAGTADTVRVYRDKESIYVLSMNLSIGYIGLQVFNREPSSFDGERELTGEVFFQGDDFSQFEKEQNLNYFTRPPRIIRALLEYTDY